MAEEPVAKVPDAEEDTFLSNLKKHIELEDNMDSDMLPIYLTAAERYVIKKIGRDEQYLKIMVATVMYDHRSATKDLKEALEALEPIFALEVLTNGSGNESATDQPAEVESDTPSPSQES